MPNLPSPSPSGAPRHFNLDVGTFVASGAAAGAAAHGNYLTIKQQRLSRHDSFLHAQKLLKARAISIESYAVFRKNQGLPESCILSEISLSANDLLSRTHWFHFNTRRKLRLLKNIEHTHFF